MKQIEFANNGKSSKHNSHHITMHILQRVVAIMLLAFVCGEVWAGDYVIFNGTYYLDGDHANKYNIGGITDFDPKTCIWTGNSGGTFKSTAGTYLYYYDGYLALLSSGGTKCTVGGTESGTTGQNIAVGNSTNKYIYLNGTTWALKSNTTSASVLFKVQTNKENESSSNPTISGDKTFSTKNESCNFSIGTAASYIQGYIDYVFYNETHHYFKSDNETPLNTKPSLEEFDYKWSLSDNANGYVSIDSKTGKVTYDKIYPTDTQVTLTLTATSKESKKVLTATKQITFKASTVSPTAVSITSANPMTVYTNCIGQAITYSLSPTTCYDNVLFESAKTSIATVDANGMVTGVSAGNTTITVKAMKYNSTEYVSATVTVNVLNKVSTPVITFNEDGKFTISCSTPGATIHYTTNGSDPTTSDATIGNGVQSANAVPDKTVVKAIAVLDGYVTSAVASAQLHINSGVSGGKVILNDLEDHNWTYYQKTDNLPSGYPTDFLTSPDPRNVKITYQGGGVDGASAVAISGLDGEGQNTMIYYKTLEKHDLSVKDDGEYAYTVISNPFSKRPKKGSTYYGFGGWKIISGGEYISEYNNGQTLPLDKTIHFTNLDNNYTPNCTSAEVVFEATWVTATVNTGTSVQTFNGGTYETNFWIINGNSNGGTVKSPCTVTMMTPDGGATNNYRESATLSGVITSGTNGVKVEFVRMNTTNSISASGFNYTLGRGIISTASNTNTGGELSGSNSNKACDNVVKVESGVYSQIINFNSSIDANKKCDQLMILGCDYDRAKNDNEKLIVQNHIITGSCSSSNTYSLNRTSGNLYMRYDVKSGNFWSNQTVTGNKQYAGGLNQNFYISFGGAQEVGRRFLLMEGGRVSGISGGQDANDKQDPSKRSVDMRIRGTAQVDGIVYGAAEFAGARGIRTLVFTGGTINGWIAGGANGTQSTGGLLEGSTYVYVGGNTTVKSDINYPNQVMNRAVGGNVFGAGCGYGATSTSGKVTLGTNVVVSDGAYIERGVYGGGSYGFCANDKTSSLFILGGTVAGKSGGVDGASYDSSVQGGVYGGACQNIGGSANIYMDDGVVETGLYGGSNKAGTLSGSVTMQINGGQVGTTTTSANIHGGGYGKDTEVTGNIDITLGKDTEDDTETGAVIYGNVYGGSALGKVNGSGNGTTIDSNKHTYVTMNLGSVNGNIFGGGMGELSSTGRAATPVAGEGVVNGQIKVTINGTDATKVTGTTKDYAVDGVFGGCDMVGYAGTPVVIVNNCKSSIEYVYGGGNASSVKGTNVTINGGDIDYAFGGGNGADATKPGADVNGNAVLNIFGGTINNIFGGSNTLGDVTGKATVTLEDKNDDCPITAKEVYGGANEAPMTGTPELKIVCLNNKLGSVYGGARAVDVNSDVTLTITGGQYGKVFGGNNESGEVKGSITVNIDETGCHPIIIDELYAGGNMAAYTTPTGKSEPTVNVISCTHIGQVFGGGYGKTAVITGNPIVNINQIPGKYDPEDDDSTDGYSDNTDGKLGTIGTVFGGGNAANVVGDTHVNIGTQANNKHLTTGSTDTPCGANITGNVYGGGNAADVTGKTNVTIGKSPTTTP